MGKGDRLALSAGILGAGILGAGILSAGVVFTSVASAQEAPQPQNIIQSARPMQTKTVQLSKVVFSPDPTKLTQKVKIGTICLFSGSPFSFGERDRTADFERFERLFDATMQKNGVTVIAKSSNLFEGADDGPKADYLIGATYRPEDINVCSSVNGVKGSLTIVAEWQIYDRAQKKVVETVTTTGKAERIKFDRLGLGGMFDDAFSNALTAMVGQESVKRHFAAKPL